MRSAVHRGEWKLVREEPQAGEARNLLFHIEQDPVESNDVAAKNPKLVAELTAAIAEWRRLHPARGVREGPQPEGYKAPSAAVLGRYGPLLIPHVPLRTVALGASSLRTGTLKVRWA